jgi:hypothetical protein
MKEDIRQIILQNAQAFETLNAALRVNAEYSVDFRVQTDRQLMLVMYVDGNPTDIRIHLSPTQWSLITQLNLRSEK